MKKIKLLIAAFMALLLCVAMLTGCGKKAEAEAKEPVKEIEQEIQEYREEYIGDPVDEEGNQGEWVVQLPEEFERPAVESLEDLTDLFDDIQLEENMDELLGIDN